jgi:uncharacterized membrane protein
MTFRAAHYWEALRASYWFVPSLMSAGAAVVAFGAGAYDQYAGDELRDQSRWIYSGGAEGARAVLGAIAGSIITVAGTTFSITIAVLSLASQQFGARVLRNFMRDRGNQFVLGSFTATYLYCLLVLRTVSDADGATLVPHFSVTLGVLLAVINVAVLIYFIHHIADSIQVSRIIDSVGQELDATLQRLFPETLGQDPPGRDDTLQHHHQSTDIRATSSGYLQAVDEETLITTAKSCGVALHLRVRPGDFILPGMVVATAFGPGHGDKFESILDSFSLGNRRTPHQDAEYAFLQLAEIAFRALSPGIHDPLTAIEALNRITKGLCALAERSLPPERRYDQDRVLRLIAHPYDYDELVEAAYSRIRQSAQHEPYVLERMRQQVEQVIARVQDERFLRALRRERHLLALPPHRDTG